MRVTALSVLLTPLLLSALGLSSCQSYEARLPSNWRAVERLNEQLPATVRVYELADKAFPLRAWHVRVDLRDDDVRLDLVVADDEDARRTVSEFARSTGACVVVNAGYFDVEDGRAACRDSTVVDGVLLDRPLSRVEKLPSPQGGALGILPDGTVDIAWTVLGEGGLREAQRPGKQTRVIAAGGSLVEKSVEWGAVDAFQSLPLLLLDGVACEPYEGTPPREPRTAAGLTSDGELVLLVVDGRQGRSRGASFADLTAMLQHLGCVDAINLDGGGSSAINVLGQRLNRPQGRLSERPVASALAVFCDRTP